MKPEGAAVPGVTLWLLRGDGMGTKQTGSGMDRHRDRGTEGHPQPPAEPDCPTPTAQTTQGHNGAAQEN